SGGGRHVSLRSVVPQVQFVRRSGKNENAWLEPACGECGSAARCPYLFVHEDISIGRRPIPGGNADARRIPLPNSIRARKANITTSAGYIVRELARRRASALIAITVGRVGGHST